MTSPKGPWWNRPSHLDDFGPWWCGVSVSRYWTESTKDWFWFSPASLGKDLSTSTQSQRPQWLCPVLLRGTRTTLRSVADPMCSPFIFQQGETEKCSCKKFACMVPESHQPKTSLKVLLFCWLCHWDWHSPSTGNYSVNGRSPIFANIFSKSPKWEQVVPWTAELMKLFLVDGSQAWTL